MLELSQSASDASSGIWMLYCGAALIILMGFLFLVNMYGISDRFFRLVTTYIPAGRATPRTMRVVGAGWIAVGTLMFLPEIVHALK